MYETNPIYSDELYYLHHDPHLADKKKIKLIEIDKSNLVMFPEDYYITRKLRRVFRDSMIDFPKIVSLVFLDQDKYISFVHNQMLIQY